MERSINVRFVATSMSYIAFIALLSPCLKLTSKASLRRTCFAVEHGIYGVQAARAEAIIVTLVTAGSAGEHYKVAILAAWCTLFRIVLDAKGQ